MTGEHGHEAHRGVVLRGRAAGHVLGGVGVIHVVLRVVAAGGRTRELVAEHDQRPLSVEVGLGELASFLPLRFVQLGLAANMQRLHSCFDSLAAHGRVARIDVLRQVSGVRPQRLLGMCAHVVLNPTFVSERQRWGALSVGPRVAETLAPSTAQKKRLV